MPDHTHISSGHNDLKPLSSTLKYDFLELNESYPVIISSSLISNQETALLNILSTYKPDIRWTID